MTNRDGRSEGGLRRRFHRHLRSHPELIPPGATVVLALSGGPDSVALLDLLNGEDPDPPWQVIAAHFDHGLRPESAREARQVVEWCRGRGIAWAAGGPAGSLGKDPAACRRERYAFLEEVRRRAGASRLLTAHHADDQAETVLFRILRGTGLRGLRGMSPRDGALARPLLPFGGDELREYVQDRGLPFLEDPSNRDPAFARSRIRHWLLPALEERDPGIRDALLRIARLAREAEASLEGLTDAIVAACRLPADGARIHGRVRLSRDRVVALDAEFRARLLHRLARSENVRMTRGGTRSAIQFITDAPSGARMDLGGGLRLGRDFDVLWIGRDHEPAGDDRGARVRLPGSGSADVRIGGTSYHVAWGPRSPDSGTGGGRALRLAPDEIGTALELRVRGWEPGDAIRLPSGTRKLKDVFVDRRVPRSLRSRLVVVADDEGRVQWVPGVCVAAGLQARAAGPARDDEEGWWIMVAESDGEGLEER